MSESSSDASSLTPPDATRLLEHAASLRRRASRERRTTSVTLLAFGALIGAMAALEAVTGQAPPWIGGTVEERDGSLGPDGPVLRTYDEPDLFPLLRLAVPVLLVALALWFKRRERVTGVGHGRASLVVLAAVALGVAFFFSPVFLYFHPGVFMTAVLLAFAAWQRDRFIALWAALAALILVLQSFYVFENRLYDLRKLLGMSPDAAADFALPGWIAVAVAAVLLLAGGVVALRKERARS